MRERKKSHRPGGHYPRKGRVTGGTSRKNIFGAGGDGEKTMRNNEVEKPKVSFESEELNGEGKKTRCPLIWEQPREGSGGNVFEVQGARGKSVSEGGEGVPRRSRLSGRKVHYAARGFWKKKIG